MGRARRLSDTWIATLELLYACCEAGVMNSLWSHNGEGIGTTKRWSYSDGSSADASAGKIVASQKSNLVYRGSTTNFFDVVGNKIDLGVGDIVCMSARYLTSYDCGYIEDSFQEVCYESRCFWDQTLASSLEAQPGTSGGAIFTYPSSGNVYAVGIQTAVTEDPNGPNDLTVYSKIDNVQLELGAYTCKNPACN